MWICSTLFSRGLFMDVCYEPLFFFMKPSHLFALQWNACLLFLRDALYPYIPLLSLFTLFKNLSFSVLISSFSALVFFSALMLNIWGILYKSKGAVLPKIWWNGNAQMMNTFPLLSHLHTCKERIIGGGAFNWMVGKH